MSNSYYTFSPRFIPGTKVRAQAVNRQFDLLEDAFDLLPTTPASIPLGKATLGIESGSGNAYVVAMPNTRVANAEGDEVTFRATHQNSGASTLQVDAIAAVSLVRWDGTALQNADILSGSYYTARYDATNTRFLITAPAQSTITGAINYAAPTGKAKLVAAGGSATTVIRSDADIAIDQTIAPTWTALHTFSAGISVTGNATVSGLFLGGSGAATAPTFSFSGDPNTGSYSVGADDWGVATGGTLRFDISTTAVTSTLPHLNPAGSNTAPAFSFSGDPNTGAYSVGADDWGVATGGTLRFDISTTAITSTLPQLGAAGSNTAPQWSFSGDPNTGAYSVGADDWGVATGGALRFDISTTAITSTLPFRAPDGAIGAPGLSFSGATSSGFYRAGGTLRLSIGSTLVTEYLATGVGILDGTAGSPGMTFFNDPDTGLYRRGSGDMGFTTNGTLRMVVADTFVAINPVAFFADGAVGAPSVAFNNDPDTGLFRVGTNSLALSVGGVNVFQLTGGSPATMTWSIGTATSVGAAGGASALPATPSGYFIINGFKVPFYNA